jgi:signal recognition particle subunit SRP72
MIVVLKASSNDREALQCKLVALIQLNKFDEALALLDKESQLNSQCTFERAYCLYRCKKLTESLELLQKSFGDGSNKDTPVKVLKLLAQVVRTQIS